MAVSVLAESQKGYICRAGDICLRLQSLVFLRLSFLQLPDLRWLRRILTLGRTYYDGAQRFVQPVQMLSCYLEREQDARMRRTEDRPFATGKVSVRLALGIYGSLAALAVQVSLMSPILTALSVRCFCDVRLDLHPI